MRFLHCVHAEFLLAFPRLTRTRLGVSLVALGTTLVWLNAHAFDALTVTLQAGALGSILGAAAIVGHDTDRAALTTALTHPTTPLAIATGRWLAIVLPPSVRVVGRVTAIGWGPTRFWRGSSRRPRSAALRWPWCSRSAAARPSRSSSLWRWPGRFRLSAWSTSHAPAWPAWPRPARWSSDLHSGTTAISQRAM